ncbi:hypothetical protein ONA70_02945 [Micromonospora yasonensis]|uniref:hypothetical protein n=1 Tax=Micromonospora yasonensis TaxID=1128667 RepID=UPI0022327FCC|nr:hypothetical protein [Micromonospora yasonensis]MCW3839052.1 hypothetical protein [Micromonospora yasonensis]
MNRAGAGPEPEDPVLRDDALLDALRRGAPPPPEDPVAALLAGWHTAIETRAARVEAAAARPAPPEPRPAAATGRPDVDDGTDRTDHGSTGPAAGLRRARPGAGRTARRRARMLSGAALTVVAMTGGVWLGAARAEPDGLLWPVTELVWTERAESLVTEREIDQLLEQARRDLGAGRYAEARADLERAATLLAHLSDDRRAGRLRTDLDDLRGRLPAAAGPASPTPPAPLPGAPLAPPSAGQPVSDPTAVTPSAVVLPDDGAGPARPASPAAPDQPSHPAPPATAPAVATPVTQASQPADDPGGGTGRPAGQPGVSATDAGPPTDIPATEGGRPARSTPTSPGAGAAAATKTPDRAAPARPAAGPGEAPAAVPAANLPR